MPVNTTLLDQALKQNQWVANGLFPQGVPEDYSWYPSGIGPNGKYDRGFAPPPAGWTAVTLWTHIFPKKGAALPPASSKIFMRDAALYLHKKGGGWIKAQAQDTVANPIQGGWFIPTPENVFPPGMTLTNRSDGVCEFLAPTQAYAAHVWPQNRASFAADSVDGVYSTMRLWVDRPECKLVAQVSADWWRDPSAPFPNNTDTGMSDWIELTTTPQQCTYTHLTREQLSADPPPPLLASEPAPAPAPAPPTAWKPVVGDVAVLKSGGSHMTIISMDTSGQCECRWHSVEGAAMAGRYPAASLRKV